MKQLIDKAALVAEIEKRLKANGAFDEVGDDAWFEDKGMCDAYKSILSFLDTIELKEVDFERELGKYVSEGIHRFFPGVEDDYCTMDSVVWQDYVIETAKHFYELGLKTQEEE